MPETTAPIRHHPYITDKSALITRMRRIEGQTKGIQRMIDSDRYCIDIVQQLSALSSAADEVALLILQSHIEGCVTDSIREQRGEEYIKELITTFRKAMKR